MVNKQGYLFSENLFKAPIRRKESTVTTQYSRCYPPRAENKGPQTASSIVRCIPKHIAKEPRGNKRFRLSGFPGANSFLFCSILVGASGLRQNEIKYCKFKQCRSCSRSTLSHSISKSKSIAFHYSIPRNNCWTERYYSSFRFWQNPPSARELSALSPIPSKELPHSQ